MPLPKPPTRPATLIDLSTATRARAARPKAKKTEAAVEAVAPEAVAPAPVSPAAASTAEAAVVAPLKPAANARPAAPQQAPVAAAPAPAPATAPSPAPAAAPSGRRKRQSAESPRLFVLDTNVLMHDPSSLFRFAEHDVFLPMMVLEELDHHKKGMSEVSRNVRQVSRALDELIATVDGDIDDGIALSALGSKEATGRLFFQTQAVASMLPASLPMGKADNQILGVVRAMQDQHPERKVVLVSKDINMRIKARTMGLPAEDYFNDQVIEDTDLLYAGTLQLPDDFWDRHGKGVESWQQGGQTFYRITGPLVSSLLLNQFVWSDGELPLTAKVKEIAGRTAVLQTLRDYGHLKNAVWGVTARNREQNFALNLLMDPEVDFVTLLGQAGTGKTLLALAAGLVQVLESRRYTEIIMTRATVPVGEDIGYLPGTEEEKMQPWMGALEDNLEVLNQTDSGAGEWGRSTTNELIRSRVKVKAMSFMRGRTFINKFLIVDEAQNLTPKQMKTLITRAGPGTKVVCLGNIAQIDTPYLTEGSSGLTYVVDRFKGWAHAGHVTLQRGERSRLADFAADAL
ncbi:PhoH family protein [Burkholderiaceae bacterium FT117]|uniref:PhoH family protein n=1 Tax=Zeimonas sediminis TaxID=2944268 RepID=UPI002342C0CA|nr:PhoH family protein [Zeimonas sediminis]MCM5572118.1 PhoH family protein [Zeimonas sediminis]